VGAIDEHAQAVHLDDHLEARVGEPAVAGRLGLDVAELVDPVVDELDGPHAPSMELDDARRIAFEDVASLEG